MSLTKLVEYSNKLVERGLTVGSGGNTSLRKGDSVYLSPSGYSLGDVEEKDFVEMSLENEEILKGEKRPTSSWATHLAIYRAMPDSVAIMHAHPPHLVALISTGRDLRPTTPDHAVLLEKSVTLPYTAATGEGLADAVREKGLGSDVILLRNHGVITSGRSVKDAFTKVELVEDAAKTQVLGSLVGKVRFLTEEEISEIMNSDVIAYKKELVKEEKD